MACFGPLTAYYSAQVNSSGKRSLVFDERKAHTGVPIRIPCGRCGGCRLERSRQWAMRCLHEKQLHKESSFITLTYDDKHLPSDGSLVLRDLQLFMKRLREKRGLYTVRDGDKNIVKYGLRFYACGEYGDRSDRPHYHALLFNADWPDKKFHTQNGRGDRYYTSAELRELWPAGNNIIGDVNFSTAAYVARYVMKKMTGPGSDDHYMGRVPEFTVMSRNPGIGTGYYKLFGDEVRDHDNVIIDGRKVPPPRFYDGLTEKVDSSRLREIKRARLRKALLNKADNTSARRRVKEIILGESLHRKKREL